MNKDLATYYEDRAKEYEKIYARPERQEDLKRSTIILQELLGNKTVLEIACGTGYWTEKIAQTATSILATDIGEKVLEVARAKKISAKKVTFLLSDLFELNLKSKYESLFGGFIWSHILQQNIEYLLKKVNKLVLPGGTVVFIDNNFVQGSSRPITQTDKVGNTYQTRKLENGSTHLVLKNFPTEFFLREKLSGIATDIHFFNLDYFWILSYKVRKDMN